MKLNSETYSYSEIPLMSDGTDFEYKTLPGPFRFVLLHQYKMAKLDPIPAKEQLTNIYPSTYYTMNEASPLFLKGMIYKKKLERDAARIRKLAGKYSIQSIVDLGCGDPERIAMIANSFENVVEKIGLDLQYNECQLESAKKLGVKLVQGNVENDLSALTDQGHDLIIMSQLIEHLYDPGRALENIRAKLRPGGLLLIETPNLGGMDYHIFKSRYWGGYHIPRHFHLFGPEALAELAKNAKLSVTKQGFLPSPGFWIISIPNALGLNSSFRGSSFFEFFNFSNLFVVAIFTAMDLLTIMIGGSTSNQYLMAKNEI